MAVGAKVNGGLRHTSNVADDLAAKREAVRDHPNPNPTISDPSLAVGDLLFASPRCFSEYGLTKICP